MTEPPRAYTTEEVRERFLAHLHALVEETDRHGPPERRAAFAQLAFGILVTLDGGSAGLPGWYLAPAPHPDDRPYQAERGERWYPAQECPVVCDIAGDLHERFLAAPPVQSLDTPPDPRPGVYHTGPGTIGIEVEMGRIGVVRAGERLSSLWSRHALPVTARIYRPVIGDTAVEELAITLVQDSVFTLPAPLPGPLLVKTTRAPKRR